MDRKYEFPLYGIDIPPNLKHNQTRTYNIYSERCENLEKCVTNPHYTIPKIRCSSDDGIILPHYTIYNKRKNQVTRTYYFPEKIDDAQICKNMNSYHSKIANREKICDSKNNICHLTISQSDIPELFNQVYEIQKQLERVFELLTIFCGSSNAANNKAIQKRINQIVDTYDEHLETILYKTSDEYLQVNRLTTREHMESIPYSLVFIPRACESKVEYKDIIKSFLQYEYTFLSHFVGFIIKNRVSVDDELTRVDSITDCIADADLSSHKSSRGAFDVLAPDASPLSEATSPIGAVQLQISIPEPIKPKIPKSPQVSEEELLKLAIEEIQQNIIHNLQEIREYHINNEFVLEYLQNESIPLENLSIIRKDAIENLNIIQQKKIILDDRSLEESAIHTIYAIDIIEIINGIPDNTTAVERILSLNPLQLEFLDQNRFKFTNKFILIFQRGAKNFEDYEKLFSMTQNSYFLNNLFFLLLVDFMIIYIDTFIKNLKQNKRGITGISKLTDDMMNLAFPYKQQNIKNDIFSSNVIHIEVLLSTINGINFIDLDKINFDPYEKLGITKDTAVNDIAKLLVASIKQNGVTPDLKLVKDLIGSRDKKDKYDKELLEHYKIVNTFYKILQYFTTKQLENLLYKRPLNFNLFTYLWSNLLKFVEEYCSHLCKNEIYKNRIEYFLNIAHRLNMNQTIDEEVLVDIMGYINERKPFYDGDINSYNEKASLMCESIIYMYRLDNMDMDNPDRENLALKFAEHTANLQSKYASPKK
jgi:hypothetical protein